MNFHEVKRFLLGGILSLSATASFADSSSVAYDSANAFEHATNGAFGIPVPFLPNTFMGAAVMLTPGTTSISGLDLYVTNLTGARVTGLRINVFIWDTINTGPYSSSNPAFSNLLGTFSWTRDAVSIRQGGLYGITGASRGVDPGLTLDRPLSLGDTSIGLTMNFQRLASDGVSYESVDGLSGLFVIDGRLTTGSDIFPNHYFRNAQGEADGNFISGPYANGAPQLKSIGLAMRVFGEVTPVPEPASYLLLGLGLTAISLARQRERALA